MNKTIIFRERITKEETTQLSSIEFKGEIRVIDKIEDIAPACEYLSKQRVIGFDTETRPSFRAGNINKTALLQLSTDSVCYLFRLNKIPLERAIMQLLESKDIMKIGADVSGDLRALRQLRHFKDNGFIDLQSIISGWGVEEKSLRKMSAIVLGKKISKAQRLSNWEASALTERQQIYAATDAWVCNKIYKTLLKTPKVDTNHSTKNHRYDN